MFFSFFLGGVVDLRQFLLKNFSYKSEWKPGNATVISSIGIKMSHWVPCGCISGFYSLISSFYWSMIRMYLSQASSQPQTAFLLLMLSRLTLSFFYSYSWFVTLFNISSSTLFWRSEAEVVVDVEACRQQIIKQTEIRNNSVQEQVATMFFLYSFIIIVICN